MKRYIAEGLQQFLEKEPIPWHMPGHKRRMNFLSEGNIIDDALAKTICIDVTEVEETDDLYEPEAMIGDSLKEITKLYGTAQSYYIVNGATGGILAAISATASKIRERGTKNPCFAIAENCHKSVFNGVRLAGVNIEYIKTKKLDENNINAYGAVEVSTVKNLCETKNIDALVLTSPTYEGVISNISEISKELHKYGAILIVDEAHGAHLPFYKREMSAIYSGADIIVQSLHKTLPAMTQTAVLHVMNEELKSEVENTIKIFMSSSPSYVMMCSMEAAIAWADDYDYDSYYSLIEGFRNKLKETKCIELVDATLLEATGGSYYDLSRLVITTKNKKVNGTLIAALLKQYGNIVVEMSGSNYVVLISSPLDGNEEFNHLLETLLRVDDEIFYNEGKYNVATNDEVILKLEALRGKISSADLFVYPPGNYVARKGEIVTDEMIEKLIEYAKSNLIIRGI